MAVAYLTTLEVIAIHDALIEVFGGRFGIRDLGALEAAVYRPQSGYYEDRISEAAALWESIVLNHPFLDGNKRTAVAAADIHLRLNGLLLDLEPEAASFIDELFREGAMRIGPYRTMVAPASATVLSMTPHPYDALTSWGRLDVVVEVEAFHHPTWC